MYMFSSPILSLAFACSLLVRLVWTSIALSISPVTATIVILCAWESLSEHSQAESTEEPVQNNWARWILFFIGTVPAAIRLCSFSGVPWTQTWGFMFISSYMVIEGVLFVSRFTLPQFPSSISEALGYTSIEWQLPDNMQLRHKVQTVIMHQESFEADMITIALFSQFALSIWAFQAILLPLCPLWKPGHTLHDIFDWLSSLISLVTFIFPVAWLLISAVRRQAYPKLKLGFLIFLAFVFLGSGIHTLVLEDGQPDFYERLDAFSFILLLMLVLITGTHAIFSAIFRYSPAIGRALLIVPTTSIPVTEVHNSRSGQDQVPNVTTGSPSAQLPTNNGVDLLLFFIFNLCLCILWYMLNYDASGTVNPAWTDIFG